MIARTVIAAAMILVGSGGITSAQTESNKQQTIGILLAAGDISTCPKRHPEPKKDWHRYANRTAEIIRAEIKKARAENPPIPVRVLALGDLAYSKGTDDQFECFAKRWSGFDDVLLPVPGNHEYLSDEAAPYFDHFKNNPYVNQNGKNKGYFSLNFPRKDGPWRLIGLNDNFEILKHHGKDMKEELKWLESKLDASNEANAQNCVLAFWHRPTFSSGRHGHDYDKAPGSKLTKERPMKSAFDMLHRHGASIVLAGHDHNYEPFKPQDANGKVTDDGLRLFVVGTGGSLLTQDNYTHTVASSDGLYGKPKGDQGVLKIELFESGYSWSFLSIGENEAAKFPMGSANCSKRK